MMCSSFMQTTMTNVSKSGNTFSLGMEWGDAQHVQAQDKKPHCLRRDTSAVARGNAAKVTTLPVVGRGACRWEYCCDKHATLLDAINPESGYQKGAERWWHPLVESKVNQR